MMTAAIEATGLTKRYRGITAVDDVTFAVQADSITGLLGGNGAGKTTLMSLLTGQQFSAAGTIKVFDQDPAENDRVLSRICFVRDSLRYPNNFRLSHVLAVGQTFYPLWDMDLAQQVIKEFDLPRRRPVAKFSRGMISAVGIMIGLASRAPITIFDEPYLGLDAAARQRFYDLLLDDYTMHPRTLILSSHLIDEIAKLFDTVLVMDKGRLVIDSDADELRGRAAVLTGQADAVEDLARPYTVLRRELMGSIATTTIYGKLDPNLSRRAAQTDVRVSAASLQQLVVNAAALRTATAASPAAKSFVGAPR